MRRHAKTPIMIQMEAVECGAASLGIVLGYYGCYLSLEELRLKCGVSRNGVNAYNILEAAKSYGMDAEGYRASVEDLRKLSMPAILFWNQNHFLVLEGINRGDLVFLNDPAAGRYSLSIKEFTQRYSGIVLTLTPSADFRKRGKPQSLVKGIFHRLRPFGDALIYLFLVQVCVLALALTLPALFRLFLDKILGENQLSWQWEFIGVFVGVAMLTGLLTWMKEIFLNVLRVRLGIHFSAEFLWHILKLPIVFFTQRSAGEVIYRMKLNTNVANVLTSQVAITLVNMLLIGVYVVIMFQYDALIASFGILICGINCAMLVIVGKFRANAYARVQQEQAKTIAISFDTLGSMETVKCAGNSDFFFSRIIGAYTRNINTGQEIAKRDTWLFTLAAFTQQASTILLLGIGVWRVMEGSLTIGMLIGLQILLSGFLSPIMSLLTFGSKLQSFEVDLNRLNDVLLQPPDPLTQERHSPSRSPADSNTNPELEFREVVFGYSPLDDPFIVNFNLRIPKGRWVALTGGVGSGKTTIARLACTLYRPWKGQIFYNGQEALTITRDAFAHLLAGVDQEIVLFSGTIRDNLTLWDHTVPDEVLVEAAKTACIHDEIMKRPGAYDSLLMEGGRNFSEGQRQRLEIARALVLRPSLLVLDEATSALDRETEGQLMANLRNRGLTCLMIAHRLNTVTYCDEVLVLENGKVVQQGTHDQLKAISGRYQSLLAQEENRV